jgi:hypothetical protein
MICVQLVKKLFFKLSKFERVRGSLLQFYASSRVQRNGNSDISSKATGGLRRLCIRLYAHDVAVIVATKILAGPFAYSVITQSDQHSISKY